MVCHEKVGFDRRIAAKEGRHLDGSGIYIQAHRVTDPYIVIAWLSRILFLLEGIDAMEYLVMQSSSVDSPIITYTKRQQCMELRLIKAMTAAPWTLSNNATSMSPAFFPGPKLLRNPDAFQRSEKHHDPRLQIKSQMPEPKLFSSRDAQQPTLSSCLMICPGHVQLYLQCKQSRS